MVLGVSVCPVACLMVKITKNVLIESQWSSGACSLDADNDDAAYMCSDQSSCVTCQLCAFALAF